jgi:hypothetical protein
MGDRFRPSGLKSIEGIQLRLINEPGEIGKTGKYKNRPLPYGSCCVCTPEAIPMPHKIEWMADFIKANKKSFSLAGATDIEFWIYWYGVQGSMEFTPVELGKIAELNIKLCINYIYKNEDE